MYDVKDFVSVFQAYWNWSRDELASSELPALSERHQLLDMWKSASLLPQYPFLSHITSKLARLAAAANLTSDVNTTAFYISDFILFYMYITIYI